MAWAGAHIQFHQLNEALEMRNVILLDNESTTSIFCNPEFVEDIQVGKEELLLSMNGGRL
jgi:hypothetical protein